MGSVIVSDILVTPMKQITIPNGDVFHAIKQSDQGYVNFGEAYFSFIKYGAVKAWKRHLRMTLNLIMPIGKALFVFVDEAGNIREEIIGSDRYVRLTIPPRIWFGFQGLDQPSNLLLNLADITHTPEEIESKKISEIDYVWEVKS